jgi:pimeloyl-ACP methyl ester carboxylesterase
MAQMTGISFTRFARSLVLATTLAVLASCGQARDPTTTMPTGSPWNLPASSSAAEPGDGEIHGTFDVDGHELFLDCTGTRTPTVVMLHGIIWDAAYGEGWADWAAVREGLTERTCAYDRRNVGQSGQVAGRSTAADAVKDLHGLLRAAEVKPPYVLAGYSFGGLLTLLYAGTYPGEIAGIVLVDATLPLEWDLDPPETRKKVKAELNNNDERIDFYGAGAMTASVLDNLPDVPIVYLRALQQKDPKEWEKGAYEAALQEFMRDLPDGRLVEYDTDHGMLINIPADVADQIQRVVAQTEA